MRSMRQQSALEMLAIYSWGIMILAGFVILSALVATPQPSANYLSSSCNLQPSIPCQQTLLSYSQASPTTLSYYVLLNNNLGDSMYLPVSTLNVSVASIIGTTQEPVGTAPYALGNCTPSFALPGSRILCKAYVTGAPKLNLGAHQAIQFTMAYQLCSGTPSSSFTCAPILYKSTGESVQSVAPASVGFRTLVIQANPQTGAVNLNGVTYVNGANVLLITSPYGIYAVPPPGYQFTGWTLSAISGGSSSVGSEAKQNTTLTLGSNATLTASFNSIAPTTTVTLTSTSTSTTTSSTTSTTTIAQQPCEQQINLPEGGSYSTGGTCCPENINAGEGSTVTTSTSGVYCSINSVNMGADSTYTNAYNTCPKHVNMGADSTYNNDVPGCAPDVDMGRGGKYQH